MNSTDRTTNFDAPYQVNEIFWSVQGEGGSAGETAVFIRLQGCPVGCPFCDSKTTWMQGGHRMTVGQILDAVRTLDPSSLIIVTGGEPLLYNLDDLFFAIHEELSWNPDIHIETSGMYSFKGNILPQKMVISPKMGYGETIKRSGKSPFHVDETVWLAAVASDRMELKYVVDNDFSPEIVNNHICQYLGILGRMQRHWKLDYHQMGYRVDPPIFLMPEGSPPSSENVQRTIDLLRTYKSWRFGPRLQYAYPEIAKIEGLNNNIITKEQAFAQVREKVGVKS